MPHSLNLRVVFGLHLFGRLAGLFAVCLGGAALLGWGTGYAVLITIHPGLAAMSPITAFCFILAGVSFLGRKSNRPAVAQALAILILCLSAAVLASYITVGRDVLNPLVGNRLDQSTDGPRAFMSPATAYGFLLLGVALTALGTRGRMNEQLVTVCAIAGALLSGLALLGYAYGVEGLYAVAFYHSTALQTAAGLFALFLACLVYDPEKGWAAIIASGRPSGVATRMQLLLAISIPSLAGLFSLSEVRSGTLAPSLAMALLVICTMIPMVARIFADGSRLDKLDMQLLAAMRDQSTLNEELERRVAKRTAELRISEAALRQSQKMEAVGKLTGGIAHDFNNLLQRIIGSLEVMQTRLSQGRSAESQRYITTAQDAAKRAAALTHRLLVFSRGQTLDPKLTNINRVIAGMAELVRNTVGPQVTVKIVAPEGLWASLVDPHQVEDALLNLAINARDAMPDGGKLVIETSNRWLDEHASREIDLPAGPYISLNVSDNGIGMPPEVSARAFDPFFTTKPIGTGTGLGLSMIYGFTRQSGGQVQICSEVGKGTKVCLLLPRHAGDPAETAYPGLPQMESSPAGATILVVDDEASVRMLAVEVLTEGGYHALEAEDGAAALVILRSDVSIDLIVSDVGLPGGMNGRQLADAARLIRPSLKVLFITGYAENAVLNHGHLSPDMHVLTKPFAMVELLHRAKELVAAP